jgi:hypothetical protein
VKGLYLSKEVVKYLSSKLRGGDSNERGNRYESHFALYNILCLLSCDREERSKYLVTSQCRSFVDDLLITKNGKEYYQLKSGKKVNWGINLIGNIHFDFHQQKRIEKKHKSKFSLSLVVSSNELKKSLDKNIPKVISDVTSVVFFPYYESVSRQIKENNNFKEKLESLIALDNPSDDKLEALASVVLGYWESTEKKDVLIESIYLKIENYNCSFLKSSSTTNIDENVETILRSINGFLFKNENGNFVWSYNGKDSGVFGNKIGSEEFKSFEENVLKMNPVNFDNLEMIMI